MTSNMVHLIDYVDRVTTVFKDVDNEFDLDLPELVVIGHQTSGKSSVLESIVGKEFLPRGEGMVTKTPIRLELNPTHGPNQGLEGGNQNLHNEYKEDWAEFGHLPDQKFHNFKDVRSEIIKEMNRLAGRKAVDNEHRMIKEEIETLVRNLIKRPNTIIVAVTVASEDLATSVGYAEAAQVDPTGERTLMVITKLDLMDQGRNAVSLLQRQDPLLQKKPKLEIVGVVNRSYKDNESGISLDTARGKEITFFKQNYPSMYEKCGSKYLSQRLQILLAKQIAENLPTLSDKINKQIAHYQSTLDSLGDTRALTDSGKLELLTTLLRQFTDNVSLAIKGEPIALPLDECIGGANIYRIFFDDFPTLLSHVDPTNGLSARQLDLMIQNTKSKPTVFTRNVVVEALVNLYVDQISTPCLEIVGSVQQALIRIIEISPQKFQGLESRYPKFFSFLLEESTSYINQLTENTKEQIKVYVETEKSLKNFNHPDFDSYEKYYMAEIEHRRNSPPGSNVPGQNTRLVLCWKQNFGWFDDNTTEPQVKDVVLESNEHRWNKKEDRDRAAAAALAYSEIVTKNTLDHIPKTITYQMLDNIKVIGRCYYEGWAISLEP